MTLEWQHNRKPKGHSIMAFLNRHPWLYVVAAFAVLIAAWATLIIIALKNRPAPLNLPRAQQVEAESGETP